MPNAPLPRLSRRSKRPRQRGTEFVGSESEVEPAFLLSKARERGTAVHNRCKRSANPTGRPQRWPSRGNWGKRPEPEQLWLGFPLPALDYVRPSTPDLHHVNPTNIQLTQLTMAGLGVLQYRFCGTSSGLSLNCPGPRPYRFPGRFDWAWNGDFGSDGTQLFELSPPEECMP